MLDELFEQAKVLRETINPGKAKKINKHLGYDDIDLHHESVLEQVQKFSEELNSIDKRIEFQRTKINTLESSTKAVKSHISSIDKKISTSHQDVNDVFKKLIINETKIQAIQQVVDSIRASKERMLEEMLKRIEDVEKKANCHVKCDKLQVSITDLDTEFRKELKRILSELENLKEDCYELINNKEKENESISRELKRMQIVNREIISDYKNTNLSNREYCSSIQCNPRNRMDKFLDQDEIDGSTNFRNNLSLFNVSTGRPIQSACNRIRPQTIDSDYTNVLNADINIRRSKNSSDESKLSKKVLNFKTLSIDYNKDNIRSSKNCSQSVGKISAHSLRISTAINSIVEAKNKNKISRYHSKKFVEECRSTSKSNHKYSAAIKNDLLNTNKTLRNQKFEIKPSTEKNSTSNTEKLEVKMRVELVNKLAKNCLNVSTTSKKNSKGKTVEKSERESCS